MAALDLTERQLLDAVARDPADEAALSVLADHWLEHGEEARGAFVQLQCGEAGARIELADEEARLAEHARRWREPLLRAGYAERDLALVRGLLQWPLAIPAGDPLDEDPDLFRISPRYYRELRELRAGSYLDAIAAEAVTPMRTERVAIKAARLPEAVPILEREHAILQRLRHPNVARDLGYAIRSSGPALVVAWAGTPLDEILDATRRHGRTLGVAFAVSVARQLCDALAAVHEADIVHREVRPDHVLVAADGTVTLIDFGFVRAAEPMTWETEYGYRRGQVSPGPISRPAIRYVSPEQALGRESDRRTDLFSAALVTCELVDNQHPAPGANVFDVLLRIRDGNLVIPALPPRIDAAIRRALTRRRADRHQTARELGEELAHAAAQSSLDTGPHVIAQILCELGIPA